MLLSTTSNQNLSKSWSPPSHSFPGALASAARAGQIAPTAAAAARTRPGGNSWDSDVAKWNKMNKNLVEHRKKENLHAYSLNLSFWLWLDQLEYPLHLRKSLGPYDSGLENSQLCWATGCHKGKKRQQELRLLPWSNKLQSFGMPWCQNDAMHLELPRRWFPLQFSRRLLF